MVVELTVGVSTDDDCGVRGAPLDCVCATVCRGGEKVDWIFGFGDDGTTFCLGGEIICFGAGASTSMLSIVLEAS